MDLRSMSFLFAPVIVACAADATDPIPSEGGTGGDADIFIDSGGLVFQDSSPDVAAPPEDAATPEVDYVYAQSAVALYKVDPVAKTMTTVGTFSGCNDVVDIAVDANNNGYASAWGPPGLYKLDLKTAACTLIATGNYPNSLSFVPAGTLDPNKEALVGYQNATYIRIDTTTGAITTIGGLTGGYSSSGDIVSVANGGTFLTVVGNGCGDCLLQVDPKTGDMVHNYGSISHSAVYGLAFWAGTAYGFDAAGALFSITWNGQNLVTSDIPTTQGLSFYGAGSTTSAPPKAADGGGIPIN